MEAFRWCQGWRWRWWRLPGPAQKALGPPLRWRLGGRYRLIEPIGRGGWSTVWRGYDERLSRPVAIKLVDPSQADWVRREAKALASLTHAHIAMIYDFDCTGSECYLVLEFVEGCSLADALDQGPLPWPEAVRYCAQLATALAAAHRCNLVHRDVKPGNVMLTPAGVKLIDFGTSSVVGEVDPDEVLRATPAYVAPERLTGNEVGPAGDVFGLGAVLYRAIAGYAPWTGTTVHEILTALTTTDPPPLPSTAGLPDAVARACLSCLSRDPAKRPTAEQVASVLSEAVPASAAERPTVTLAFGGPRHRRAPKPYSASVRAAIAAGLVALLAGLGYLMIESHPARSPVASVRVVTPNCPPGVAPAPGAVGETVSGSVVAAPPAETATVQIGHKTGKSNMDIKDRGGPQKRGQS